MVATCTPSDPAMRAWTEQKVKYRSGAKPLAKLMPVYHKSPKGILPKFQFLFHLWLLRIYRFRGFHGEMSQFPSPYAKCQSFFLCLNIFMNGASILVRTSCYRNTMTQRLWLIFVLVAIWGSSLVHDDVIKWKHFPRYWPFVRGIHRSPVNSLHKGQWGGAAMFSLIYVWINSCNVINNRKAGDLRRYRAHRDFIVM